MEWYNPDNRKVFTLTIPLDATTEKHPYRYFWGIMSFDLIHMIKGKKYGEWIVKIPTLKTSYTFHIKDLSIGYKNNLLKGNNPMTLDYKI